MNQHVYFSHHYIPFFCFSQNAMRATVETHENSTHLPPIKVRVSLGHEDLTIKVCFPLEEIKACSRWFQHLDVLGSQPDCSNYRCQTGEEACLWGRLNVSLVICIPQHQALWPTTLATHHWWDRAALFHCISVLGNSHCVRKNITLIIWKIS